MDKWILRNWLILAIASLLVGFWVAFAEDFVEGKAYMFFFLFLVFMFTWLKKSGKL
jgi:hypothetical protein